ncbi:unnamed protein product [Caenorhabditis sp. 36 PRJEB53466]|nr:unnamed protein product [Caenorhabditis sp. 36 PRJEB53466]
MRYSQKCRVTAVLLENIRAGLDIKRSFEELIKTWRSGSSESSKFRKTRSSCWDSAFRRSPAVRPPIVPPRQCSNHPPLHRHPQQVRRQSQQQPRRRHPRRTRSCSGSSPPGREPSPWLLRNRPSVDMMLRSKRTAPVVVSGKPKCPAMSLDPPARVAVAQKPKKLSSEAENEKLQQFVAARKRALPGAAPKVVPAGGRPSETLSMLESSRLFRIQQAQDIKRFGEPERKRQRRNYH